MRCFTLSARDPGHEIRKPDPAEHERKICSCLTSFFDQIGFQRRYETYYSGTLN